MSGGPNMSAGAMLTPLAEITFLTPGSPPPLTPQAAPQAAPQATASFTAAMGATMSEADSTMQLATTVLMQPNADPGADIYLLAKQVLTLNEIVKQLKMQLASKAA